MMIKNETLVRIQDYISRTRTSNSAMPDYVKCVRKNRNAVECFWQMVISYITSCYFEEKSVELMCPTRPYI